MGSSILEQGSIRAWAVLFFLSISGGIYSGESSSSSPFGSDGLMAEVARIQEFLEEDLTIFEETMDGIIDLILYHNSSPSAQNLKESLAVLIGSGKTPKAVSRLYGDRDVEGGERRVFGIPGVSVPLEIIGIALATYLAAKFWNKVSAFLHYRCKEKTNKLHEAYAAELKEYKAHIDHEVAQLRENVVHLLTQFNELEKISRKRIEQHKADLQAQIQVFDQRMTAIMDAVKADLEAVTEQIIFFGSANKQLEQKTAEAIKAIQRIRNRLDDYIRKLEHSLLT